MPKKDRVQIHVEIIRANVLESEFTFEVPGCMIQELRLMHEVFVHIAQNRGMELPNMAETFAKLSSLGTDAALKVYGATRYDLMSKDLVKRVRKWW